MGTNYYLKKTCTCCGHEDERHLGKSSAEWTFLFQALPEYGVFDLDSWTKHIQERMAEGYTLEDEYGTEHDLPYLLDLIESKRDGMEDRGAYSYADRDGHVFATGEFS